MILIQCYYLVSIFLVGAGWVERPFSAMRCMHENIILFFIHSKHKQVFFIFTDLQVEEMGSNALRRNGDGVEDDLNQQHPDLKDQDSKSGTISQKFQRIFLTFLNYQKVQTLFLQNFYFKEKRCKHLRFISENNSLFLTHNNFSILLFHFNLWGKKLNNSQAFL